MVMVDRYSGWPFYSALTSMTTESLWRKLCSWFYVFGFPLRIKSDGGPQFRQTFVSICSQHGISHELASAYNPTSNGHAESFVKNVKPGHTYALHSCSATELSTAPGAHSSAKFHPRWITR